MRASFGPAQAEADAAAGPAAVGADLAAAAQMPSTRQRIVQRAEQGVGEPAAAKVVDLADQRRRRPERPPAPVAGGATVLPFPAGRAREAAPVVVEAPIESAGVAHEVESLGVRPARPPPARGGPAITAAPALAIVPAPAEPVAVAARDTAGTRGPAPAPEGVKAAPAAAEAAAPAPDAARAPTTSAAAAPAGAAAEAGPAAAIADAQPDAAAAQPAEAERAPQPAEHAPAARDAAPSAAEAEAEAEAAAPRVARNPEDEPGFQAMKRRARAVAGVAKTHQPAAEGAATAYGAAAAPANDVASQAAGAQVEVMGEQEPGVFDARAFVEAVRRAVAAATPSTLEDVDEFKGSGAVGDATAEIGGLVEGGKTTSEADIEAAVTAAPDGSVATPKTVEEMVNDAPGEAAADVGASRALPGPRPAEETDLSAGPAQVDAEMARASVTDEQIARSNEPDFSAAIDARQKAREHAATAPGAYRSEEEAILAQGREQAAGDAGAALAGMHGARAGALGGAVGEKEGAKGGHEAEHARIAADIQAMYETTKADVQSILDGLDAKVDDEFTRGEEAARTRFEDEVDQRMRAYKSDRYDVVGGSLLWLKDKVAGMPDEVSAFYTDGREHYLQAMDTVIEGIANTVGTELTAARARIVEGRAQIHAYVESLDASVRSIGADAEGKLEDKFDELDAEVDAKQDALVDAVAKRYVESRDALDARIEELQAENKGLVAAALDAVVGVIKTILALGEMLLRVLAKAAEVVGDIIADPIGFLGNLIAGVMGGLNRFVARIGTHLQNALVDWLFGTLGDAGITLPDKLDGAGILDLVTQVIGLTYANIRARVARVVGEPVVARMEQTVDVFKTLASVGIGGLWEFVREKVGDLQETVLGKIKEWVVERVITGAIAWIIGLLNPVAAFIKACKAIYSIVMFIVERAKQIMEFVNSILDSISAIAKGNIGAAVEKVEGSLAKGLPLAIGFLAGLLGLGNIAEKIKAIIAAVRRPIEKAIDFVVIGTARAFKRTVGGAVGAVKGKLAAGRAFATAKSDALREAARPKLAPSDAPQPHEPAGIDQPRPADAELEHDAAIRTGLAAIAAKEADYVVGGKISYDDAVKVAAKVKAGHPVFSRLEVVEGDHDWNYRWAGSGGGVHVTPATALPGDPGVSAPGVGRIGTHGSKPSSLRKGPEIHWLESEHVIPFATGKRLWEMVNLVVPGRGGHEDRGQTTIMIYEGAARIKTPADNELSAAFEAAVGRADLRRTLTAARRAYDAGSRSAMRVATDIVSQLMRGLRVAKENSVTRTNAAIAEENALKTEGSQRTNGERRGPAGAPESPLPSADAVAGAADTQYDNIVGLVEQEVSAVNILVRR